MTEEQLAAQLAAVVTPQRLWDELDTRRRALRLAWWQVAVQADVSEPSLRALKYGQRSAYERARAWLERSRE
ncbi:hypothetical protein ABT061_15700 [Streptosporangium sp. NPDC002544]|uniref:hypothetical protein n=1 Tax=Streptosporangium sp. NPDC002544 TaxID=3154538 RepID=UPI00332E911B